MRNLVLSVALLSVGFGFGCGPAAGVNNAANGSAAKANNAPRPSPKTPTSENPLMVAAREGKDDVVRALVTGTDLDVNLTDADGNTPLIEAARFGHNDVVWALIANGGNYKIKNKAGETALMLAVKNSHDDVVRILKEAGAKE